jgi:Skp family chaperone for outer membrane proteins
MKKPLSSPLALLAAGALALSAVFTLSRATAQAGGAPPAAQPTSIAVIDISKVLEQCNEGNDERARLAASDEANRKELSGIENQLKEIRAKLEPMSKDDPQRRDLEAQYNALAARGKTIYGDMQRETDRAYGATMWRLYSKIDDAVKRYGAENGLDAVMVYDELTPPKDPQNVSTTAVRAITQGRSVLYRSPRIDITDKVILKLNTEYAASGGKPGAAAPAPAAPARAARAAAPQPKAAPKKKGG